MAASYLGICSLTSAFTKNQVISFVISFAVCLGVVFLGWSIFNGVMERALPVWLVDLLANFSFVTHFDAFTKGIVDPKDIVFFLSLTGFTLFLNVLALER
jgi:ABC-2 type transport system permease protein